MKVQLQIVLILWTFFGIFFVESFRNVFKGVVNTIPVVPGVPLPPSLWFNQTLNHFDPTDTRQWRQRYFINDTFYKDGGPVFLMIGGEGPASPAWMVNGSWVDYAKKFNAFLVQLEHRYYGESHPTPNLSVKNLEYLSSEQALADLATFVTKLKAERNLTESKVIAFGGSYPGSLAVWFRLKYPHIVHASVSSSAPLIAQINFKEYLDVVVSSLEEAGSKSCVQEIKNGTTAISSLLLHRVGWKVIEKTFRLCKPLDGKKKKDVSNLMEMIAESFEDVVQYNEDNREFEGAKGTNITIQTLCNIMTDKSLGTPLERLAAVNSLRLKISEEECLDHTYASMLNDLKNISWTNNTENGGRQWMYQTCTEFGFYQTSESDSQPFGNQFPLSFFVQQCSDIFGMKFSIELLRQAVERTNIMYGGKTPKVTRVVLVNGSIDPWHYLSLTQAHDNNIKIIFINGTAHCANMYPEASEDSQQLKTARKDIENIIKEWLLEDMKEQ